MFFPYHQMSKRSMLPLLMDDPSLKNWEDWENPGLDDGCHIPNISRKNHDLHISSLLESLFFMRKKKNMLDSKITFLFLSFMGRSRFFMDSLPMFHSKNHCFMVKSVLFMLKSPFVVVTSRFFTVKSLCFMDSIPIFMVKLWKIQFFR